MTAASEPDNTPLSGTVFSPRQVSMLKIAVIVMGILLVGGFGLVMATIVYQASKLGETSAGASAPAAVAQGALGLPKDATVMSMALDGNRLALHLKSSAGSEIAVIDVRSGQVLSRIRLNADKP
jgi:hypothetical protein